jgi:hypothetical protein
MAPDASPTFCSLAARSRDQKRETNLGNKRDKCAFMESIAGLRFCKSTAAFCALTAMGKRHPLTNTVDTMIVAHQGSPVVIKVASIALSIHPTGVKAEENPKLFKSPKFEICCNLGRISLDSKRIEGKEASTGT